MNGTFLKRTGAIRSSLCLLLASCSQGSSPLLSASAFVAEYRAKNGTLPSDVEFADWAKQYNGRYEFSYFTNRPTGLMTWGTNGIDFVVGVKLAGWNVTTDYYCSWDKRTFDGYVTR